MACILIKLTNCFSKKNACVRKLPVSSTTFNVDNENHFIRKCSAKALENAKNHHLQLVKKVAVILNHFVAHFMQKSFSREVLQLKVLEETEPHIL